MQDFVGKQIDRYRITERLGVGGMAVVYKAYDTRLEREVALKLIRTDEIPPSQYEKLMKRFEREAKAQARFSHPNIISVFDYGEVDGAPYLVMEFIPGGTLKHHMIQPVDYHRAIKWLIPIAEALQYAHQRSTIHRDIKPSNILFDERHQPILTDFGIAKLLETDEATLTGTGLGVGTPEYMAPEQWRGQAFPATDQYALGVVLYELLTGQKPYKADTPAAVAILQATEPLRSPRALDPGIPESVEKLLYKALAKDPKDRYIDMDAFRKALEEQLIKKPAEADEPVEKNQIPPEPILPSQPPFGSEAETIDSLEHTPADSVPEPDHVAPGQGPKKSGQRKVKLPSWLLWAGTAVLAVVLIGVVITRLTGAIGNGGPTAVVPNPETNLEPVAETAIETVSEPVEVEWVEAEVPVEPEPPPIDRTGGWFDTIIVVEEPSTDAAITRLEVEEIDIFIFTVSNPEAAAKVEAAPNIDYYQSFGSYNELTFNPTGPLWGDGRLNPFGVPRIREAMNYLIDRDYITQEIMGGLGTPRWTAFNTASNDSATFAAEIRAIELKYAYNPALAEEIISEEMEALGAERVDRIWTFNGRPVEIIILIRIEDERLEIGDYVANQLEDIGFQVLRDYKSAADASPIWLSGDPNTGEMHIYTGGWITTVIPRDLGGNFAFFYTDMGLPFPLWQNYVNDPEFYDLAKRLDGSDYATLEERAEMVARTLDLSLEDGARLWLADRNAINPKLTNISVAADLYGNVAGGWLWALTIQRAGELGGSLTMAMPSILTEPWNPVAGSNWIYDMTLIRATSEMATYPDPFTGLALPNRITSADVVVQEGLPVFSTLDWVNLSFADEILVPNDAWADWNAAEQRFITVGELNAGSITALRKSTVYYQEDLFDVVQWHDGSPLSMGDFLMGMILTFDRAKQDSAIFDDAAVAAFDSFMSSFKGVRIVSTDPLIIETYSDVYYQDAEQSVSTWWPYYAQGPGAWHNLYLGILAEAGGQAVFSSAKSDALAVDRLGYISGPTVEILKNQLDLWAEEGDLPYKPIFSQFVGQAEVTLRIENLTDWYNRFGHFWVGTGPYFLQRAFPVEGTVILQNNPFFPDLVTRWSRYAEAAIPVVKVDGATRMTIGSEEVYEVLVTFQGEPYALEDIKSVTFLIVDATNQIAHVGEAVAVEDGLFEIVLTPAITSALATGSNTLEVVAVSNLVAVPVTDSLTFGTVE